MSFCSQCGGENPQNAKFCVNCGAKLEQVPVSGNTDGTAAGDQTFTYQEQPGEGAYFSTEPDWDAQTAAFEKVTDAEEFAPDPIPTMQQEEIHINYGNVEDEGYQQPYQGSPFETRTTQSVATGNIGVSIAAMVCGIISLLCCCTGVFGAVLAIAAVVLGIVALRSNYAGKGMAIAGIATGGISLFLLIIMLIFSGTAAFSDMLSDVTSDILW